MLIHLNDRKHTIPQQIFKNTLKITHLKHSLTNPTPPKKNTAMVSNDSLHLPFSAVSASWSKQWMEVTEAPRWVWLQSRKATEYSSEEYCIVFRALGEEKFRSQWYLFYLSILLGGLKLLSSHLSSASFLLISLTRLASHLHICPPPVSPLPRICWSCLRWLPQPFGGQTINSLIVLGCFWLDSKHGMTNVPVRLSSLSVSCCISSLLTMWSLSIDVSSRIRNPQPSQNIIEVGKRVCWKYFRVNAHICLYI